MATNVNQTSVVKTMTDVTGSVFISYRRSPARAKGDEEALQVRNALRDRGVPTWRDLDDLRPVPIESELIATLASEEVAGAVLLISPEIETSNVVRVVEAPAILGRFRQQDGFFLQPVLIDLDYGDVDRVLGRPGAFQAVRNFNIIQIAKESLDADNARQIANSVLKQRLAAFRARNPHQEFSVGLYSRRSPSAQGLTLRHDVTPYFTGRVAAAKAYANIETALCDAASALAATGTATGNRIPIVARGNAALPLGVLFGAVYAPFVFDLVWKQSAPWGSVENWSIKSDVADIATIVRDSKGDPTSEDLLLAVSVNALVDHAAAEYAEATNLSLRATISVGLTDGPLKRGQSITPQQGLKIARDAVNAARGLKDQLGMKRANLHLFLSCPLALAVLIGQDLNTFGTCFVYEHFSEREPAYVRVHDFNPSGFTYQIR